MTDPDDPWWITTHVLKRRDYEAGDQGALFGTLYWCFLHNSPVPPWAANAFLEQYRKGNEGYIRSWDEVFGKPERYGTGERVRRRIEEEQKALEAVRQWRAEGKPMNEDAFAQIAENTGVGGKSKLADAKRRAHVAEAARRPLRPPLGQKSFQNFRRYPAKPARYSFLATQ